MNDRNAPEATNLYVSVPRSLLRWALNYVPDGRAGYYELLSILESKPEPHKSVEPSQEATLQDRLRTVECYPQLDKLTREAADAVDAKDARIKELDDAAFAFRNEVARLTAQRDAVLRLCDKWDSISTVEVRRILEGDNA